MHYYEYMAYFSVTYLRLPRQGYGNLNWDLPYLVTVFGID
jgi:hypothetical protein